MTGLDGVLPAPQFAREAPSPPPPHHHSAFAEIEEAAEHEVHSLRELFRRRRLSVRTMERPLRLATGAALASLIGVIVLIALRDVDAGQTVIGRVSGVVNEVSTPLFVATLVFVSIGFAYVITGAILASWPLAVLALLVITGTIGYYTGAFGSLLGFSGFIELLPGWARWSARGLLMAIWVVAVAVMLFDRRFGRVGPTRKVRLTVLTIYAALFGGFFTVLAVGSPTVGGLNLFPESISLMMFEIVDLVTPILLVAAVDFGEWGGLTGERIAAAVKTKAPGLLTPVAVLASLGMLAYGYLKLDHHTALVSTTRLWSAGKALLLAAGGLAVILLVGRAVGAHRRRWPATLNFAALFAVCALLTYLIAPVSGVIAGQFKGVTTPIEQVTPEGE